MVVDVVTGLARRGLERDPGDGWSWSLAPLAAP
jgi:hypothetical protein